MSLLPHILFLHLATSPSSSSPHASFAMSFSVLLLFSSCRFPFCADFPFRTYHQPRKAIPWWKSKKGAGSSKREETTSNTRLHCLSSKALSLMSQFTRSFSLSANYFSLRCLCLLTVHFLIQHHSNTSNFHTCASSIVFALIHSFFSCRHRGHCLLRRVEAHARL